MSTRVADTAHKADLTHRLASTCEAKMKTIHLNPEIATIAARAVAEDRIIGRLCELPNDVAYVTALELEATLANRWKLEMRGRMQLGDQNTYHLIYPADLTRLSMQLAEKPTNVPADLKAAQSALSALIVFGLDQAWLTAKKINRYFEQRRARRLPSNGTFKAELDWR